MSRRHLFAAVGLGLLAAAAVAGSLLWSHRAVDVVLQHPPLDVVAWEAYTRRLRTTPPPTGPLVDEVRAAFVAANRAEVAAGPAPDKNLTYLGAVQAWERAARTLTHAADTRSYFQLGRWEGLRLVEALNAFLGACAAADTPVIECLEVESPPTPTQAYIDAGGAFVRFATAGGFIEDGRLVPERIPMLQAVFLQHWGGVLRTRINVHAHFTAEELEWLNRWRVEWQADAPVDHRVAAAEQLRHLPDYPADLNAGALLYQAGRYAEAAQRFERVDSPLGHKWRRAALAHTEP